MVTIIFETHGTTLDNERGIASGKNDVALSPLGERQAAELGTRRVHERLNLIFCSEQQRSWRTAEIAFAARRTPHRQGCPAQRVRLRRVERAGQGRGAGKARRTHHPPLPRRRELPANDPTDARLPV